jgi:drug/metabolite transporter (DMT)-like permease
VLSGIVLLGEPVSPFIVIGGAMTIGGVAVVLRRERVPVGSF